MYFDYQNPKTTTKVCVKTCPSEQIRSRDEYIKFSKNFGSLCLYNTSVDSYDEKNCPKLPILKT
jgi:hypothetical protein